MIAFASVARLENVSKRYGSGAGAQLAVREVSLEVRAGEFVALMGRSGCGKTTLLNLLGAMDLPTSGQVWLDGHDTARLSDDALTALRRQRVGFVFQAFHLLATLNVRENIELPLLLARDHERRQARVNAMAERVELGAKLDAFPHQLSGGEAQRVALARALIHLPALIVADEPTGNLDTQSAANVIALLARLAADSNAAVVMATHSPEAASHAHRIITLHDGAVAPNP